jgi:DNA-binding response OmpR family regulator
VGVSEVVNRSVKPVVLIIDDEATNRVLVRAYLGPGYDIHEAADGPAGLELLKQRPVDLVLLDVMMPGTSGFDICRIIKQTAREDRYLPVVLLTALGAHDDRMNGLQAGADDFLTKPVDRQELLLRVETFIKLRRQDQHIHRQVQELTQRDAIIRAQLKEVRELDALKDELVSLMVHDLRNPLAGIDAFLAFLEKSVADGEIKEDAQIALQASSRLRETLEDILQVRMLESGTVRLHRELVEVDLLVREAIT